MNLLPVVVGFEEKQQAVRWESFSGRRRAINPAPAQSLSAWEINVAQTFKEYIPFSHDFSVYDSMRLNLPIVDAIYTKYKMLVGMPEFDFGKNKEAEKAATEFIETIRVNQFDRGVYQWIIQLMDSALHYGNGYGELVPSKSLNDVAYLKNAPTKNIRFVKLPDGTLFLAQFDEFGRKIIPFQQQDFIYHLAFWKREGHPQGYSLLYPLNITANIIHYVSMSMKKHWLRVGDPTFAFFIETDKDMKAIGDYESARSAVEELVARWELVQQGRLKGQFGDVAGALPPGSSVILKTIGEGVNPPDFEVSMRLLIEQIVAQSGFPLFMFGFHWGGNYNLTTHQNDMIINQINFIRDCLDPLIDKMMNQFFLLRGILNVQYDWVWPDVNLRDEVEQAKAALDLSSALKIGIESRIMALELGMMSPESFVDWLVEQGVEEEKFARMMSSSKLAELFRQRYVLAKVREVDRE